jgi:hypothetical protein
MGVVTLSQTERNLPTIANVDASDFSDLGCWLIVQIGPITLNVTTPIEVPVIARSRPRTADIRRDRRPELQEPPPDRLVGCVNTSLGQQFLDIPKGQCEPGIEPDRVADDFWREAVALKRRSHPTMLIGDQPQS